MCCVLELVFSQANTLKGNSLIHSVKMYLGKEEKGIIIIDHLFDHQLIMKKFTSAVSARDIVCI